MVLKYLEWNLHAKGGIGYKMPGFIVDYVKMVDIFALVEFSNGTGWDILRNELLNEFDLFYTPFSIKGYNQICIGIRKNIGYKMLSVIYADPWNTKVPEYLEIQVEIDNKKLSIIGTRIKTQGNTKDDQFKWLNEYLREKERFICLGDYNCVQSVLAKKFKNIAEVYGPRVINGYYSFVFKNGDTHGLDWVLSKNIKIYNNYSDKDDSPYATYDWEFVTEKNGYGNKAEYDYLGLNNLPDHAILKGMFEI